MSEIIIQDGQTFCYKCGILYWNKEYDRCPLCKLKEDFDRLSISARCCDNKREALKQPRCNAAKMLEALEADSCGG